MESVSVHETKASSPSRRMSWMPFSASNPSVSPFAFISSHFLVSAASIDLAACKIIATGAALSVAPMNPVGVILES
jgi:hypothetical protein